jgi:hypothetical protein
MSILILAALLAEGRPLFYWGARPPVVSASAERRPGDEAAVNEVHAALDEGSLVLRFTFDRPVREAIYLPDGSPVSGRLRVVVYLDVDDDRATGADLGALDLRTGADRRLEVGVLSIGEDADEKREAAAAVTASLAALSREARRRTLWRGDDRATPRRVSARGEWVEVKLPPDPAIRPGTRIVLAAGERTADGRLRP